MTLDKHEVELIAAAASAWKAYCAISEPGPALDEAERRWRQAAGPHLVFVLIASFERQEVTHG